MAMVVWGASRSAGVVATALRSPGGHERFIESRGFAGNCSMMRRMREEGRDDGSQARDGWRYVSAAHDSFTRQVGGWSCRHARMTIGSCKLRGWFMRSVPGRTEEDSLR